MAVNQRRLPTITRVTIATAASIKRTVLCHQALCVSDVAQCGHFQLKWRAGGAQLSHKARSARMASAAAAGVGGGGAAFLPEHIYTRNDTVHMLQQRTDSSACPRRTWRRGTACTAQRCACGTTTHNSTCRVVITLGRNRMLVGERAFHSLSWPRSTRTGAKARGKCRKGPPVKYVHEQTREHLPNE